MHFYLNNYNSSKKKHIYMTNDDNIKIYEYTMEYKIYVRRVKFVSIMLKSYLLLMSECLLH